jgi:putative transposase
MVTKQDMLSLSGVPRSSFYYKRRDSVHERKPSMMNISQDRELVDNTIDLQDVEPTIQQEFCCYGYKSICDEFKD